VALLTGMEVANASMYDGATATVEAVMMANRVTRRTRAVLSGGLHPHYREVIETHGKFTGFQVTAAPADAAGNEDLTRLIDGTTSCVVVQNPSFFGHVLDLSALAKACQAAGALLVVAVSEIVSLGAIVPPGEMGADIVTAEGQSLGVALSYGGPYVGLFATRDKYIRQMPGRLTGQTIDVDGKRGWVLTLSTREQHIRREKATSNICTNSGLCALAFNIHLTLLGEAGLTKLAALNHATASRLADHLSAIPGVELITQSFFNEFTLKLPKPAAEVVEALAKRRILGGVPVSRLYPDDPGLANLLLVAATETVSDEDIAAYEAALKEVLK
jgi:glycine dehydrogenase subunit 1